MEFPNVVHPKPISINGHVFEVVAYCALTDEQALRIAMHYVRTHRMPKKPLKRVIRIVTQFDRDSLGLL